MSSPTILAAPIQDAVVDQTGHARKTWTFFFNQLVAGDDGTEWTPKATNLSGTNTLNGKYFKNSGFIDFWVTIDTTTTSSATLGTTYIDLPFDVTQASPCFAVYGSTSAMGLIDPSTNRLFPPSFSSTSVVTITARVFTK